MITAYTIEINDPYITSIGDRAGIAFNNLISTKQLQLDNVNASITGVSSAFLNIVIDTIGDRKKLDKKTINTVIDFFTSNNVPWVWITPSYMPSSYLLEHGFTLSESYPCMYFDLSNTITPIENMQYFIIKELVSGNDLSEWIIPINECFSEMHEKCNTQDDLYQKINANLLTSDPGKLRHFVIYYDKQIAGAATLFLYNNSVVLNNIAVRTHLQRKGIGKALTLHMMHIAKKLGFKHCLLDASDSGYKLYRQLGFKIYDVKDAYKKIGLLYECYV